MKATRLPKSRRTDPATWAAPGRVPLRDPIAEALYAARMQRDFEDWEKERQERIAKARAWREERRERLSLMQKAVWAPGGKRRGL